MPVRLEYKYQQGDLRSELKISYFEAINSYTNIVIPWLINITQKNKQTQMYERTID